MKTLVPSIVGVLLVAISSASASLMVIRVTGPTQGESPIVFTMDVTPAEDLVSVAFSMPMEQSALENLWRVDVWIMGEDGNTRVVVPLELLHNEESGILSATFLVHRDMLTGARVAVRCGEYAPLAELVYEIDVASFSP